MSIETTTPPSGRRLRALTKAAARGHGGAPWYAIFGDVYTYVLCAVVALTMAYRAAALLGSGFHGEAAGSATLAFEPAWLLVLAALATAGPILAVLIRLGPVGISGAGAVWWLPTPADRSSLLRPTAIGWLAGTTVVGGAVGLLGAALADVPVLAPILGGLGLGLVGAGGVIYRQTTAQLTVRTRARSRMLARFADASLVVAVALRGALALWTPPAPSVPGLAVAVVLLGCGMAVAVVALRGVGGIPGADLIAHGSRMQEATYAIRTLDLRGLGQVLTDAGADLRSRSRSLRAVTGQVSALAMADALLLARSPWQLTVMIGAIGLPLALAAAGTSVPMVLIGMALAGMLAANASGAGARSAHFAPVLDRVLGLSASRARLVRLIPGAAVTGAWSLVVLGLLPVVFGGGFAPVWLVLAVALAVGLAATGSITAYRAAPDWSKPLVVTPYGAYPPGLFQALAVGPMVSLVCLAPTLLAIGVGAQGALSTITLVQLVLSGILVAIAGYVGKPKRR